MNGKIKQLSNARWLALAGLTLALVAAAPAGPTPPTVSLEGGPAPTTPDFRICDPRSPGAMEQHPDVAYNPDRDEYLVVFDVTDDELDYNIAGVFLEGNGQPVGTPIPIVTNPLYADSYPAVAYNPDAGSYLVVWERSKLSEAYEAIMARVIAETPGPPVVVHWSIHGHQRRPDVDYSALNERFLVAWESGEPYGVPPAILATTVDASATEIPTAIVISDEGTTPGQQRNAAVAASDTIGQWLVVWADTRNSAATGCDIFGQQVGYEAGVPMRSKFNTPIGVLPGQAEEPAIAWGPVHGGEYMVVWPESGNDLYGRRIKSDITFAGNLIAVSKNDRGMYRPAVCFAAGPQDWWVAWESG